MTDDEYRLFLRTLLRERQTGMPRWRVGKPGKPLPPVVFSDSELEIAARRKVLEDYHTTMEATG